MAFRSVYLPTRSSNIYKRSILIYLHIVYLEVTGVCVYDSRFYYEGEFQKGIRFFICHCFQHVSKHKQLCFSSVNLETKQETANNLSVMFKMLTLASKTVCGTSDTSEQIKVVR